MVGAIKYAVFIYKRCTAPPGAVAVRWRPPSLSTEQRGSAHIPLGSFPLRPAAPAAPCGAAEPPSLRFAPWQARWRTEAKNARGTLKVPRMGDAAVTSRSVRGVRCLSQRLDPRS